MNDNEKKSTFLLDSMKENLAHARHIENERHSFFSLYLVAVGLFLGNILLTHTYEIDWPRVIVCVLMLMLHAVVKNLFHRWNSAYKSHMQRAQKLYDKYMRVNDIYYDELGKDDYYYYPASIHQEDYLISTGEYIKKFRDILRPGKKADDGSLRRSDIKTYDLLMMFLFAIGIIEMFALVKSLLPASVRIAIWKWLKRIIRSVM